MTDREKRNLRGPVHTVREELQREGAAKADLPISEDVYNEKGDLISHSAHEFKSPFRTGLTPEIGNQEPRFVTFSNAPQRGAVPVPHRPRIQSSAGPKPGERTTIYFLPKVKHPKPLALAFRNADHVVMVSEAATVTSIEDAQGNEIELIAHDAEHKLLMRGVNKLDPQGRPVESVFYAGDLSRALVGDQDNPPPKEVRQAFVAAFPPGSEFSRVVYRYDENGRIVERTQKAVMGMETHKSIAYDDHGNEREVTSTRNRATETLRYEYEYDSHGNWTMRTVIQEDSPPFTIIRTITYY